jgi:hypothetical protein
MALMLHTLHRGRRAHEDTPTITTYEVDDMTTTKDNFIKEYGDKLSDSTKRAQWIDSTSEHEDHKGATLATRNHDVIKQWAEERNAVPATVPGTEHGDHLGVMRFNFPGYGGDNLQEVSWDEWFKTFDDRKLVFLYQEHKSNGDQSNFFRFDSPFREDG